MTTTRQRLGDLARILGLLKRAHWSALDAVEDGSSADAARCRTVLARACDAIDRLGGVAVRHFGTGDDGSRFCPPGIRLVVKSHPIAGQPGLALLPAPADPAVERWQRVVPVEQQSEPRQLRPPTAGAGAMLVRPSTDYEAFLAKQLSPKTRKAYAADMRHFLNAAGLQDPDDLLAAGPETLIAYRNSMIEAGVAPSTIARRLSTLRSFFSMLVTLGRMERNPADPKLVRSPRVPREGVTPGIEPHEARKMLKAPDTSKVIGKRDRALLAVGLYMGLRRDEIAGLKFSDIREERGHHVLEVRGKGGKARVLPMPPAAYSALQEYLTAAGRSGGTADMPLFTSIKRPVRNCPLALPPCPRVTNLSEAQCIRSDRQMKLPYTRASRRRTVHGFPTNRTVHGFPGKETDGDNA